MFQVYQDARRKHEELKRERDEKTAELQEAKKANAPLQHRLDKMQEDINKMDRAQDAKVMVAMGTSKYVVTVLDM